MKIMMNNSKNTDLTAMNVTWSDEDLKLYQNRLGFKEATTFTIAKIAQWLTLVLERHF